MSRDKLYWFFVPELLLLLWLRLRVTDSLEQCETAHPRFASLASASQCMANAVRMRPTRVDNKTKHVLSVLELVFCGHCCALRSSVA